jgi:hypothetical protein
MKPLEEGGEEEETDASSHEKEATLHLVEIDILWNVLNHSDVSRDTVIMKLNYLSVQRQRNGLNELSQGHQSNSRLSTV